MGNVRGLGGYPPLSIRPMLVLIFETNLLWSARLVRTLKSLGHEPMLRGRMPESSEGAEVAIVNLGDSELDASELIARLHELGVKTIAHAGHKEKELHDLGRRAGADLLATNGKLTFKLDELLAQVMVPDRPGS